MHDIWDFVIRVMVAFIGLLLTIAGFLIHFVLSNLETRIKEQAERIERLEEMVADIRVQAAEVRGRSGHD